MSRAKSLIFTSLFLCLLFACTSANGQRPLYPKELRGTWELKELGNCRLPLDADTQSALEIRPTILHQYEEKIRPVSTAKIVSSPATWKIDFLSDADEYTSVESAVFVLNQYGFLTVSDEHKTNIYIRCK